MNDDIVTRLRNEFEYYDHAQEAADEIERLKVNLERMKKVAKRLFDAHGHYAGDETWCAAYMSETAECDCGYQYLKDQYERAVDGE